MRLPLWSLVVCSIACGHSESFDGAAPADGAGAGVSFGGAQDIGELRGILDRGQVPGPDVLDANGFFNEHYNAPSPASCGGVLCVSPGMSVGQDWLLGNHQMTLQLSVSTTVDPKDYPRLPMNLVVVVDHSGSMASDGRLDKVKHGLHTMIDHLQDDDRLAIVEFDDRVDVDAPLGATLDRPALHAIVDRLTPRGATNIYDGLQQGFRLLGDKPASERQNRVIFLSDGLATAGDVYQDDILTMASGHVATGIGLTTIGVGDEFDVALMRGLAEQGAGNFYFLEDPTAADEVFGEELDYFVQPLALDVRLDATPGPGFLFGEAVGSTLWQPAPGSGSMKIPAVFVSSRTTQSGGSSGGRRGGGSMLFIQMVPMAGNTGRVASVTLSYRTPGSTERVTQTINLDYTAAPEETPAQPYLSSPEMAERYGMYNTFVGLRSATRSPDAPCALAILAATRAAATTWNTRHEDPDIAADLVLIDQYTANLRALTPGAEPAALSSCPAATQPYASGGVYPTYPTYPIEPPGSYPADDQQRGYRYGCSSGTPSGLAPLGLALLGLRRRRGARATADARA